MRNARFQLAEAAAQALLAEYSRQLAPPAYVSEVRGNGLFARISIGKAYGVHPGVVVRFMKHEKVANPITGTMEVRKTQLAVGEVVKSDNDSAWVKIHLFHYRKVHIGTMVEL